MRALYARWDFGSDNGFDPGVLDADKVEGWYVEPSYKTALTGFLPGEIGFSLDIVNGMKEATADRWQIMR